MVPRSVGKRGTGRTAQRSCRRGLVAVGAWAAEPRALRAVPAPPRGRGAEPSRSLPQGAALRAAAAPGGGEPRPGASPAGPKLLVCAAPVSAQSGGAAPLPAE